MMTDVSQNHSLLFSIEKEASWQSLLNQNILGIAQVSLKGKWINGNEKICDILGYSWEELQQINIQYITYPDDFSAEVERLYQLENEVFNNFCIEKRYVRKDRSIIWVKQTLSTIKNTLGKPQGYLFIIEDISEQKIIESALSNSHKQVDKVLESMELLIEKHQQAKEELIEGSHHARLGGDIGFALTQSQTLQELLDCCAEAIIQHLNINSVYFWIVDYQGNFPETILKSWSHKNEETAKKFQDILEYFNIQTIVETGHPCLIDNFLYLPKSSNIPIKHISLSFVGYPLKIDENVVGVIAFLGNHTFSHNILNTIRGITDQIALGIQHKQNELILQKERKHLQQIVTYAPVAIAMFDPWMNYIAYSEKWLQDYGLDHQDLRGKNIYEKKTSIPTQWKEIYQKVLQGKIQSNSEDVLIQDNGNKLYLRWAMHPWYNLDNTVGGVIMATQVINELVEAREKALEAVRIKSRFFTTMSHDIRTPMNGVLGMTDLLLKTPLTREQKDFVETLKTSGQNLLSLINDLLDFSKLEAGEMSLNYQVFDLQECLENVIELLANQANSKNIELLLLIAPNVPSVLQGDRHRLQQIITNLASNALKFTEEGAVIIDIKVETQTQTQIKLKFEVKDTGVGIAPEDQDKLFLSFSQVGEAERGKYGGTGLGLSICKQLTDLMQGEIGVESKINQGSTFWCVLPFLKQLNPEVLSFSQVSPLEGLKLLLIDHSLSYEMIYRYAENWKMEWYQAPSLATAITSLYQEAGDGKPYDIALVDIQSTKIDCNQLNAMIRQDKILQKTRWLFIITNNQYPQVESLLNQEIDGYILKPLRVSHLLDTFMNVARKSDLSQNTLVTINKPSRQNFRILLVEDTPTNQKVITYQLQTLGYQVKCVNNGQEALNELHQQSYDVVLMDCLMPVLDGYETTRQLRQEEGKSRHTTIIAMTAHAFDQDRQKCLDVGMDDYISKPVTIETLDGMLSRWLPEKLDLNITLDQSQTSPEKEDQVSDLIDFTRLNELTRGDILFQKEVISTFIEDASEYIAQIRINIIKLQPDLVAHYAHQLKGSSSMTGIYYIPQIAKNIEITAKENPDDLSQYLDYIPQIQTILEKLSTVDKIFC
jgi:PAS domain S-box-containing protein